MNSATSLLCHEQQPSVVDRQTRSCFYDETFIAFLRNYLTNLLNFKTFSYYKYKFCIVEDSFLKSVNIFRYQELP